MKVRADSAKNASDVSNVLPLASTRRMHQDFIQQVAKVGQSISQVLAKKVEIGVMYQPDSRR